MIRTLIIDDVQLARERLKRCLGEEPGVEVVGECDNGERAVAAIRTLRPDLIFLDVQMPALDGFGVLDALGGERLPAVIFVTAYNEYAIQAFEVNALDYLLKPVDCKRLHKAVERVRSQAAPAPAENLDARFRALIEDIKSPPRHLKRLTIRQTGRTILLPADEIDWVETYGNYLKVHAGRESHLIRGTMQQLEAKLDPEKFVRVHRSALVNIEKVKEIYPRSNGDQDLVLHDGRQLILSRNYRDKFLSLLGEL
ncbi:MAG TPA: LytTR family transcriptional regulator DNA-binding domain-containing protein [Pyrinomonadaceae bacterium]|nr:LytTR family transcriptional regulator DNA-binding domain-containing protein [Pyrinomonadaceae bacterium]